MLCEATNATVNCLLIDDLLSGESVLSGFFSSQCRIPVRPVPFVWRDGEDLHEALQCAHHKARGPGSLSAIVARGCGCDAALALAEQLPVAKLVLIEPEAPPPASLVNMTRDLAGRRRQVRRLHAFARRNLALCVSDTLVIEREGARGGRTLREGGLNAHSQLKRLLVSVKKDKNMCIIREFDLKTAIASFLQSGELPKSLAENPEMCIIYE